MIQYGAPLRLSDADREALGHELQGMIQDLRDQHRDMFENLKKAWSWYEAEKATEVKNTPFERASNAVIPLIRVHCDATNARYTLLLRSKEDVWTARSRNEEFVKSGLVRELPAFLNWAARNEFDFDTPTSDWTLEIIVAGSGVLAVGWDREEATVVVPGTRKADRILLRDGPVLEHIPREHCLWDQNYRAWEAPLFVRRSLLTWADVVQRVNQAGWDWEAAKAIHGTHVDAYEPGGMEVASEKRDRLGTDQDSGPEAYKPYEFCEAWIDWPVVQRSLSIKPPDELERGDELATIVVFLHPATGRVMAVTAKPYALPGKPFYDAYFKKRSGTHSSDGLGYILRDMQEVASTMVNQSIDAVSRANSIMGATSDPQLAKSRFALNRLVYSMDAGQVQEFGKGKNIMPDLALMNQMNVFAERLTGITDPGLGREMRMGGHPAPATSTLSLLQESKKLDIPAIRSIRQCLKRAGMDILMLYQQFGRAQAGRIVRAIGREDGVKVLSWLFPTEAPVLGNVELDLAAISETMNPDLERQKALANFQITGNFYALVTQYLTIVANPQAPQVLAGAMLKGLQALQASFQNILENNDVDDIRDFMLDLDQVARTVAADREAAARAAAKSPVAVAARATGGPQGGNGAAIGSGLGG